MWPGNIKPIFLSTSSKNHRVICSQWHFCDERIAHIGLVGLLSDAIKTLRRNWYHTNSAICRNTGFKSLKMTSSQVISTLTISTSKLQTRGVTRDWPFELTDFHYDLRAITFCAKRSLRQRHIAYCFLDRNQFVRD